MQPKAYKKVNFEKFANEKLSSREKQIFKFHPMVTKNIKRAGLIFLEFLILWDFDRALVDSNLISCPQGNQFWRGKQKFRNSNKSKKCVKDLIADIQFLYRLPKFIDLEGVSEGHNAIISLQKKTTSEKKYRKTSKLRQKEFKRYKKDILASVKWLRKVVFEIWLDRYTLKVVQVVHTRNNYERHK